MGGVNSKRLFCRGSTTDNNGQRACLDKAPRLSISIVIWILSSDTDTIFQLNQFDTNLFVLNCRLNIVRRQCCLGMSAKMHYIAFEPHRFWICFQMNTHHRVVKDFLIRWKSANYVDILRDCPANLFLYYAHSKTARRSKIKLHRLRKNWGMTTPGFNKPIQKDLQAQWTRFGQCKKAQSQ